MGLKEGFMGNKKGLLILLLTFVVLFVVYFAFRSTTKSDNKGSGAQSQEESRGLGLFLDVTSPTDGAKVSSSTLLVSGKTLPSAEVFVNDSESEADINGVFKVKIELEEG